MRTILLSALFGAAHSAYVMNQAGCVATGIAFDAAVDYFPEKTVSDLSDKWNVEYANYYKRVRMVGLGIEYQLVQCFADAAANDAAKAAAPACDAAQGCYRFPVPFTAASVSDISLIGFFDELGILDRIDASNIHAPVSPCYTAKPNTFAPVATFSASTAVDHTTTISIPVNEETNAIARAEYVELIGVYTNKEGWANYISSRVSQSFDIQSALLSSKLSADSVKPKMLWIKDITATGFATFRSDAWLNNLMVSAMVDMLGFQSASLETTSAAFQALLIEADVVVVETPSVSSSAAMIQKLTLSDSSTYKFITTSVNYIFQVDKIKAAGSASNDFMEHSVVAPDLLFSDILSAVSHFGARRTVSPWNTVKRVYLRFASELPQLPGTLTDQHKDQCTMADGRVRADGVNDIRASVMVAPKSFTSNPQSAIGVYDPMTDYFPQKSSPNHAEHFSITYHLSWKLVRNLNYVRAVSKKPHRADTILVMKGTPGPSANILPWAVRVQIPIEKAAFTSSTDYAIALLLGKLHTATAGSAPISCALQQRAVGQVVDPYSGTPLDPISEVVFSSSDSEKNVISTATSERGLLERAEWLFFFAAFYNLEVRASSTFAEIHTRYFCVQAKGDERNSQNTKPRVAVLSYSTWSKLPYEMSRAHYQIEAITMAGGIVANEDPTNSAYVPNLEPGAATGFADIAALRAALVDVDIIIDVTWKSGSTSDTPVVLDDVLAYMGLTRDDIANKKWFRYDKRMDNTGFSDYFTRATVEVDAFLQDYISMFHPESLPSHDRFFFRDMINDEQLSVVSKDDCPYQGTDKLPVAVSEEVGSPIAHLTVCITECVERFNEQYCNEGDSCVWQNGACVPAPTAAPVVPVPPVPVPAVDLVPIGAASGIVIDISVTVTGDLGTIAASTTLMGSTIASNIRSDKAPCKEICEQGSSTCFTCQGESFDRATTLAGTAYVIIFQAGTELDAAAVDAILSGILADFVTTKGLGTFDGLTILVVSSWGSDDDDMAPVIAGAVVGSVCFLCIVIVLVYIFCCRSTDESNHDDMQDDTEMHMDAGESAPDC